MALTNKLTAIANAIREKIGTTAKLTLDEMPTAISNIKIDATEPYIEETYDNNGDIAKAKFVGHRLIRANAFYNCNTIQSVNLPSSLIRIEKDAFYNCTRLALTGLPSSLISIGANAFYNCTKLKAITFEGKPTSISSTAFKSCTNLTTINVPWAEGEVANAPWGATNATINYNYTGGLNYAENYTL